MAEVLSLRANTPIDKPRLHDVALLLRSLADEVDAGEFGDTKDPELILRVVGVIRASGRDPICFSFGASLGAEQTFMDLHAGAQQLLHMRHPERT